MSSRVDSAFLARVGSNVRQLRKEHQMTIQQLADAADLSRGMLTQIELGQANPSLVTLDKVAHALTTDFAGLVIDASREALTTVPDAAATPIWSSTAGSRGRLHTTALHRGGPELWTWELAPGDRYRAMPDGPGSEEHYYVISGELTIETSDAGTAHLTAGHAARLDTHRQYEYANLGSHPCLFVRVACVNTPKKR